jgi:hypothetical protein
MAGMIPGTMDIGDMGHIGGPDITGMIPGTLLITAGILLITAGMILGITITGAGMILGIIVTGAGIIPDIQVIGGLVAMHTTLIMAIPEAAALHIVGL